MAKGNFNEEGVDLKPSPPREEEEVAPNRRNRLFLMLSAINLVVVGVVTGVVFAWQAGDPEEASPPVVPMGLVPSLSKAEEFQRAGHPRQAMQLYREAGALPRAGTSALVYRMAVCAEQVQDLELAADLYEKGTRHASDEIAAACTLGEARLLLKSGRADDALHSLSRLATVSSRPIFTSTPLGASLHYLLALAQTAKAAPARTSALHKDHTFGAALDFHLEEALRLVPREGNQLQLQSRGDDWTEVGVHVHGTARNPSTTLLSASLDGQPISVLLDLLAAETAWSISLSDVAREIVSAKPLDVFVRDKTASELLTLVLEPQRLAWSFADGTLNIESRTRVPEEERARQHRVRAVTLLHSALAEAPEHFLAPQAYLSLGNVASFEGEYKRAQTNYLEAVERFPQRHTAQRCTFNLAKSHYRVGETEEARKAFYRVIDLRRGSQLEPLAYLYLGRMAFDEGDFVMAKRELARALKFAKLPLYESAASVTLAAAHLIEEGSDSAATANSILFEHRAAFQEASFRHQVVYLSAVTRFRTALRREDVRRRERELLAACMNVHPDSFFGDFGYLLLGRTFSELTLSTEAVQLYTEGIENQELAIGMRHHLLFELAKEYQRQNEDAKAAQLLDELSKSDAPAWAARAATRLAQLLYELKSYDECIAHCRDAVFRGYGEAENASLLRQLGRVYEELGDHEMASLCFAGLLPSRPTALAETPR